jgi:hypothetical protein
MRLAELGALYLLCGLGCAALAALRPAKPWTRACDGLLMTLLWPLYGPFFLSREAGSEPEGAESEIAFLAALRRAAGTPLASLLPDPATARALARRLRVASGKVDEIDALLSRQEFDEREAVARQGELRQRGASECAQSTVAIRVQNIRRLRSLRDRFARELDEVRELLVQLTTQAEVVRLAGAPDPDARELVQELVSRVEGLDRMLDDDPCPTPTPARAPFAVAGSDPAR